MGDGMRRARLVAELCCTPPKMRVPCPLHRPSKVVLIVRSLSSANKPRTRPRDPLRTLLCIGALLVRDERN